MPAKTIPDQNATVVSNDTIPLPHEHFAAITPIDQFRHDSLASVEIDAGIREITGTRLDDGQIATHAIIFDRQFYDRDAAQRWLSGRQLSVLQFDPAAMDTYANVTASVAFDAPLLLTANASTQRLPSFTVQAYSGGPLSVSGFPYPVVVDLTGLEQYDEQSPIILDHKVDQPLGHALVTNGQTYLSASGVFSFDNEHRQHVLNAHRNGFRWRASIGCEIQEAHLVPAGQTFQANGRTHEGPLIHATRARLKEITVCASGADPDATLTIAATAAVSPASIGATPMTFSEWLADKGFDEATLSDKAKAMLQSMYDAEQAAANENAEAESDVDTKPPTDQAQARARVRASSDEDQIQAAAVANLRAQYAAERSRQAGITRARRSVLQPYGANIPQKLEATISELELRASSDGWSVERFELEAMRAARPHPTAIRSSQSDAGLNSRVLEAACCVAGGMRSEHLERQFGDQTLTNANRLYGRNMTLKRLLLEASWANGGTCRFLNNDSDLRQVLQDIDWSHRDLRADFSTFSLPGILSNLANKFLEEGFWAMESAWKKIAKVRSVNDFKPHTSFRFFGDMTYEKLGKNSEIRHGSVGEIKYVNAVDTYAKMFTTTRQDIRNDDLGALTELPRMMGMGAADALNNLFWTTFLAGLDGYGVTMWYTAATTLANGGKINPNRLTGVVAGTANSGLGLEGLENAKRTFSQQIKPNGTPLGIIPRLLLVPPALEVTAENFRKFPEVRTTPGSSGKTGGYITGNPFVGMFETVMSAYLGTSSPLSGTSDTKWWLMGDPAQVPLIEVAFLDGQETPTVQSSEADFDVLGIQHRGFFDPGVALQEPRAAVQCDGA